MTAALFVFIYRNYVLIMVLIIALHFIRISFFSFFTENIFFSLLIVELQV